MPNSKLLNTETIVTSSNTTLTIFTFYSDNIVNCTGEDVIMSRPNILQALIAGIFGVKNTVPYIQGELLITAKNMPTEIDMFLNASGDLNVADIDANNYFIDNNGDLQYILCE